MYCSVLIMKNTNTYNDIARNVEEQTLGSCFMVPAASFSIIALILIGLSIIF